jgi:hypothetical protein
VGVAVIGGKGRLVIVISALKALELDQLDKEKRPSHPFYLFEIALTNFKSRSTAF